jgi:hypothetical protein
MATAEAQRKWRAKKRLAAAASRKLDQAIDAAQASRELYTPSKNQAGMTPISTLPKPKHSVKRPPPLDLKRTEGSSVWDNLEGGLPSRKAR